jgi:hypothetical protein
MDETTANERFSQFSAAEPALAARFSGSQWEAVNPSTYRRASLDGELEFLATEIGFSCSRRGA